MQPRIYTYKITFEEIPHWYWGVHKEKKFGEIYWGSPVTHRWMWEFYTPETQILEFFPYTEDGWKQANLVEDRLIRPDLNNPLCLNEFVNGAGVSLSVRSQNGASTIKRFLELNPNHQSEVGKLGGRRAVELGYLDQYRTSDHQSRVGKIGGSVRATQDSFKDLRNENLEKMNSTLWVDPLHPEFGAHTAGALSIIQKSKGLPFGKQYRVRVE